MRTIVSMSQQSGSRLTMYDRSHDATEEKPIDATGERDLLEQMSVFQSKRRNRVYDPLPNVRRPTQDEEKLKQLGYVE